MDGLNKIREIMKQITTADNGEKILELEQAVKGIEEEYQKKEQELTKMKDKFVDVISNYGISPAKQEAETPQQDEPIDIDEALVKAFNNVMKGDK